MDQRAGWSVGEVSRDLRGRICVGRNAHGTLPGPVQTTEGAELFALLQWLRHIDPISLLTPRFFTDNQRVADGWNMGWNTGEPWVEHRDLWEQVRAIRGDTRADIRVEWLPRTGRVAADGRGLVAALRAYGNAWADAKAKLGRGLHPAPPGEATALARVASFTEQLIVHYARLLDWATSGPGRLPDITPLEALFRTPRPPPLPEHCFVDDGEGDERCIRCLLPPALARGRPCREHGTLRHRPARLGSGVFCIMCGGFLLPAAGAAE